MKPPRKVYVAVSGGPDSMAAVDFLKNNHSVTLLHFNHGTEHGKEAAAFVVDYAQKNSYPLIVGMISREIEKGESKEEFWRNERYAFFNAVAGTGTIVLAHNLDDAVENWLFTSIHGNPRLIPPKRDNFIRPFILTRKRDLEGWCDNKGIPYVMDPSNLDLAHPRARLRNVIIPEILNINPGIYKTIIKKYLRDK